MHDDHDHGGKIFRDAWIAGVTTHYPGTPKESYVAPWESTPDWERASAAAVARQIVHFVEITNGAASRLTAEAKGQFVALCWIGQIYAHIPDPKPGYVAPWHELPEWQQKTDIGIFEAIERSVVATNPSATSA